MRILALLLAFAIPASAQWQIGQRGFRSSATTRHAANIMGLNEFNQVFSETANTLDGMRFTYSQFQQQTGLPTAAADSCSASYNNKFYIIGGYGATSSTYLTNVQIYDPSTDSWSTGTSLSTGNWGAACSVYNGKIYYFAGVTAAHPQPTGTNTAFVYDIAGNSWSSLTNLPASFPDGMMAVTVGNFIYLLWQSSFYKFDPSASGGLGSYTALTTPPAAIQVQWAATGYVNVSGDDRIYYIAGSTASGGGWTNANYYYSVTNSTWSAAQATAPYSGHGELQNSVYNGAIYFTGGYDGTVFHPDLWAYTPATNTWSSRLATANSWRDGIMGGFFGNILFVIGGRDAQNSGSPFGLAVNESFQIGSSPTTQTFTKLQVHFGSVTSGNVRFGIYADSSGNPGALILDAGATPIVSGWAVISGLSVSSLTLGNAYWLAFDMDTTTNVSYTGGAPANSFTTSAHCFKNSQTYGALPSTWPTSTGCTQTSMYAEKLTVN